MVKFLSVLWHFWLGIRKSIRPVKLSDEVLVWLSVWSEVQMICIWSSWCHCHPSSFVSLKSRMVLPFWYWLTQVFLEKSLLNGCSMVKLLIVMLQGFAFRCNWYRRRWRCDSLCSVRMVRKSVCIVILHHWCRQLKHLRSGRTNKKSIVRQHLGDGCTIWPETTCLGCSRPWCIWLICFHLL